MNIVWYWWGFRLYVDDSVLHQLTDALAQGAPVASNFLSTMGYGWLSPLGTAITNWGVTTLRTMDSSCTHRGNCLTVPWSLWNSYVSCR